MRLRRPAAALAWLLGLAAAAVALQWAGRGALAAPPLGDPGRWQAWLEARGAIAAGFAIGFNRGEHGHPAGLRTTILVSLAACVAMLQANLLLPMSGRAADSFVNLDLMRLPLGILSGMGFIGAGAIIRRGKLVVGVATAATLWFVTVIGLCFGAGLLALGAISTAVAVGVLTLLKNLERHLRQDRRARLVVVTEAAGPGQIEIQEGLRRDGYDLTSCAISYDVARKRQTLICSVQWHGRPADLAVPALVGAFASRADVRRIAWNPHGE